MLATKVIAMPEKVQPKINSLESALHEWEKAVGRENVITDTAKISYYENTTFKTSQSVSAILTPKNREEVQACVRIANEYKTPLYPVSKGYNWGYGSRVPAESGCVVISLERLNNITGYDEELAYITVEPGTTFRQVYDFLKEKNSNLIAPAIGSTSAASLIGNALERGVGQGIYADRFQHCCNMEVVLPNGEFIQTGFGNMENVHSKNIFKWGVGPTIDGLFSQSNFGIVTRMTFWLSRKPAYFQAIFYTIKNNDQLEKAVDALRQLKLEGTLTTASIISNSHRILSMKRQFPWAEVKDDNATLPQRYVDELEKNALKGAVWVGDDAIMAPTKAIGKARAKRVKQLLGAVVDDMIIINDRVARIGTMLWRPIKALTGVDLRELMYFFYNSTHLGIPMEKQLSVCYWRKKTPVPANIDIDRDKCGVISLTPSVPLQGSHVIKVMGIMENICRKYGFEPNLGLKTMSERHLICVPQIIYDRETPGQDKKAMDCYNEMLKTLTDEGYPPYRLGVQSMDKMTSTSSEYVQLVNILKSSIDPNNIISPGHYGIGS